jgi:hypothetical protein
VATGRKGGRPLGVQVYVPGRRRRGLVESAILVMVLVAFARLHAVVAQDAAAATAHAHAVQSLERGLHLDIELTTNRWLAQHEALIGPAVLLYRLYYAILLGVLVWVFFGHPDIYLRARRTFVAMTGLALLVFWVLPTSPPRFALPGVVDIIAEHDILATHAGRSANGSVDLTAMPSLHVGWSAWCAYVAWSAGRGSHPRLALLAWLFPLAMAADVLGTGNHYVLDVGGSAVLLAASIAVATWWARLVDRVFRPPDRGVAARGQGAQTVMGGPGDPRVRGLASSDGERERGGAPGDG